MLDAPLNVKQIVPLIMNWRAPSIFQFFCYRSSKTSTIYLRRVWFPLLPTYFFMDWRCPKNSMRTDRLAVTFTRPSPVRHPHPPTSFILSMSPSARGLRGEDGGGWWWDSPVPGLIWHYRGEIGTVPPIEVRAIAAALSASSCASDQMNVCESAYTELLLLLVV